MQFYLIAGAERNDDTDPNAMFSFGKCVGSVAQIKFCGWLPAFIFIAKTGIYFECGASGQNDVPLKPLLL